MAAVAPEAPFTAEEVMAARGFSRERRVDFGALSDDVKWWIGGQMDGDGCVSVCKINGLLVRVGKAENAWHTLVHLKRFMGGAVYDSRGERGERQAERQWVLRGRAALDFCGAIRNFCFLKRPQMIKALEFERLLYAGWSAKMRPVRGTRVTDGAILTFPSVSEAVRRTGFSSIFANLRGICSHAGGYRWEYLPNPVDRAALAAERARLEADISAMKRTEHDAITEDLPLPYVAGFVDADGCVRADRVTVSQKHRAVCYAMQRQFGGCVSQGEVPNGSIAFLWSTTSMADARALAARLRPFLIEKAAQVDVMLVDGPSAVRRNAVMSTMKGHQGRRANAANRPVWRAALAEAERQLADGLKV